MPQASASAFRSVQVLTRAFDDQLALEPRQGRGDVETRADEVAAVLPRSCISAVNLAETISKMVEHGKPLDEVSYQIEPLRIPGISFDAVQAKAVASLWKAMRVTDLSLGDRASLSLALQTSPPALTTERDWGECALDIEIVKIR